MFNQNFRQNTCVVKVFSSRLLLYITIPNNNGKQNLIQRLIVEPQLIFQTLSYLRAVRRHDG